VKRRRSEIQEATMQANDSNPSANALVGTVTIDRKAAKSGDKVKITFTVRNSGRQPVKVAFNSGKRFDVEVSRKPEPNVRYAKGALTLWQLSRGMFYTMALGELVWAPGETRRFEAVWTVAPDTPACDVVLRSWVTASGNELARAVVELKVNGGAPPPGR
jgi:hypothetical protein